MSEATVIHGDCIEVMRTMDANSVDSIVTDPPYGLGFMGKKWDDLPPGKEWAEECLRVLKPGGHLLAFGGTRTWHRLAVAIEDAGFEIRDSIAWLYGSGFPKSRDIGKELPNWAGWGTALKPAFEPIVMARKPFAGIVRSNIEQYGTGAINIDASRLDAGDEKLGRPQGRDIRGGKFGSGAAYVKSTIVTETNPGGRYPANVAFDASQSAGLSTARFFYCAKPNKQERPVVDGVSHPTVKPLSLMRYLVKLVTPPDGTVLEPFAGSGATVEACLLGGFNVIAIEREAEYLPLIEARIERNEAA